MAEENKDEYVPEENENKESTDNTVDKTFETDVLAALAQLAESQALLVEMIETRMPVTTQADEKTDEDETDDSLEDETDDLDVDELDKLLN